MLKRHGRFALVGTVGLMTVGVVVGLTNQILAGDDEHSALQRPEILAIRFHADWCAACKQLESVFSKLQQRVSDSAVLFLTLDITDDASRRQAEYMVAFLDLNTMWRQYSKKVGTIVLVDARDKRVVDSVPASDDAETIASAIRSVLLTGSTFQPSPEPIVEFAPSSGDQLNSITHPDLRDELLGMMQQDQDARRKMLEADDSRKPWSQDMSEIDRHNTHRMKQVIERYGWPGRSMVGDDGAQAAWLLVQHADHDLEFQQKCLKLMKAQLDNSEVFRGNVAYLTDRVLVNEGKPQVYATQFHLVDGVQQPRPMIDPDHVDQRRQKMGLSTLEEYRELMRSCMGD